MRPYLALIKDSFRAAIASWVLYVLLAVITLLLLVIAPLHVVERLDWKVVLGENVVKPEQLAKRLVERGENEKYPATMRVWDKLEAKTRTKLTKWVEFINDESVMPDGQQRAIHEMDSQDRMIKDLNAVINDRTLYDEAAWANRRLNAEAKDLIAEGVENLSTERSRRLNRLLVASAVGGLIKRGTETSMELRYAIWSVRDITFNVSHKQFSLAATGAVTWVFDWVLWIGLFIAILVTANIIPETFHPGSLNLLLSKPISRWGLLFAKFLGGCVYVSLCATYLFLGVWLWMGLALGVWEPRILWSVPLYIIVFAIYYSVSTLVGVWSRSQILSIVMTILFWAFCFGIGVSHSWVANLISHNRPVDLVASGEQVMHIGSMHEVSQWDESRSAWKEELAINMIGPQEMVFQFTAAASSADNGGPDGIDRIGPVLDPRSKKFVVGMPDLSDMGSINHLNLYVSDVDNVGFREMGKLPRGAVQLFSDKDGVLAVDGSGKFWRMNDLTDKATKAATAKNDADKDAEQDSNENTDSAQESALTRLIPDVLKTKKGQFTEIGPKKRTSGLSRSRVAFDAVERSIVTLATNELSVYRLGDDGDYYLAEKKDISDFIPVKVRSMLDAGGNLIVLTLGNGQVHTFSGTTLEHQKTYLPQKESRFRTVRSSNDGRYFVFSCFNKKIWLLDTQDPDSITQPSIPEQGTVTAIAFDGQGRLWIGDTSDHANLYEVDSLSQVTARSPGATLMGTFYHYFLRPFYWICPKPGEFYKVVAHVSRSDKDSEESEEETPDTNLPRSSSNVDPYQPLWSGLLFMFAMLFLAGLVFWRRDY